MIGGCRRPDCLNRGILVLDADSVVFLLNGIVLFVCETYPGLREWDKRLPSIRSVLAEVLCIFRKCSLDGRLYMPERILREELDLVRPSRSVRKWLRGSYLGKLTKRHRMTLQRVLETFVTPLGVSNDEKESLRQTFRPEVRPADRDSTVLLVACELGRSGRRTLVLAHDHGYERPIRQLRGNGRVELASGRVFPTTHLERRPYESFLLSMHESCCLDSDRFQALSTAFNESQVARLVDTDERRVKKLIADSVLPFMAETRKSIRTKESWPCFPAWQT